MKKHLITIGLMIAIIGIIASIHFKDFLFAISFLWVLINGIVELLDEH